MNSWETYKLILIVFSSICTIPDEQVALAAPVAPTVGKTVAKASTKKNATVNTVEEKQEAAQEPTEEATEEQASEEIKDTDVPKTSISTEEQSTMNSSAEESTVAATNSNSPLKVVLALIGLVFVGGVASVFIKKRNQK